ncbi:DUF4231 domain-containing protein [bacterium]
MNQEDYLRNRLDDQIQWYDKKSISSQKAYKRIRSMEIIFAALIPLLSVISVYEGLIKIIIALLGTAIVIFAGINGMNKYQELWIGYRTTTETLKHHKYLFEAQCTPYNKNDAFVRLVENVEAIISREHSNWSSMIKDQQKKQNKSGK